MAPSALKVNPKDLELGGKYARTYFVVSYPRFLNRHWLSQIINLNREFDISIFIHPVETRAALRDFRKKVAQIESQIIERESKGLVRDPKLDIAHQDLEGIRDKLQQATERLFEVGLYFTVYGETQEDLSRVEGEIKSVLEARLIFMKPALFQQEQGYRSTIPLGIDLLGVHTKLNSEPLSSMFPFVSVSLSAEKGILYGINRHNNSLVLFDRYNLPNYNSVCFATSGAGKSFAVKLEVLRSLMVGTDVIVIDPEKEYERMAIASGGRYFNISLNSEHHINPFDLPQILPDETPSDILRTTINELVGFFRVILGGLTTEEDAIIDRAIVETYALKDITIDTDFSGSDVPLLSDFQLVLRGIEGGSGLAKKLFKYTEGSWAGFINKPTNVDLNKQFIAFSIRDMQEDLRPAAMHIITRFIWNSVRRSLHKRLLIVDEAWIMMEYEDTASFLYGMVKRGRKYYLGVATITQDVSDFLKSQYGTAILNNASMVLLLRQSPTSIDLLVKTFNLTQAEKFLLLEAAVGVGIFIAGLKRVSIQVQASYIEEQLITTDPSQILKMRKEGKI